MRVACSIDMFTVDLMRLSSVDDVKQKNHKGGGRGITTLNQRGVSPLLSFN